MSLPNRYYKKPNTKSGKEKQRLNKKEHKGPIPGIKYKPKTTNNPKNAKTVAKRKVSSHGC